MSLDKDVMGLINKAQKRLFINGISLKKKDTMKLALNNLLEIDFKNLAKKEKFKSL